MNASYTISPKSIGVSSVHADPVDVTRLLVLVPNRGFDTTELARIIWNLAAPCCLPVLYLSLGGQESGVRLRVITLASLTRDERVNVDIVVTAGANWVRAAREALRPGDIVICFSDQLIRVQGMGVRPLYDVLERVLHVPVYVVPMMSDAVAPVRASSDGITQLITSHLRQVVLFSICSLVFIAQLPEVRMILARLYAFCSTALRVAVLR